MVFALMGYVIANMQPDSEVGAQVELNPKILATILGEKEEAVIGAIELLCGEDEDSRSKAAGGKRLIRLGQFSYQVVNGVHYLKIRSEEALREYNREAKRKQRRGKGLMGPLPGEVAFLKAEAEGHQKGADSVVTEALPAPKEHLKQGWDPEKFNAIVGRKDAAGPFPEV